MSNKNQAALQQTEGRAGKPTEGRAGKPTERWEGNIERVRRWILRINSLAIFRSDNGSAVVEFTVLAIPLLIPIVMYLGVIHDNSTITNDLHNLARQSARAFITSPSEGNEEARLQSVLNVFVEKIFRPNGIAEIPTLSVLCSATPCLTPNAKVEVTASLAHYERHFTGFLRLIPSPASDFSATNTQVVDAWR